MAAMDPLSGGRFRGSNSTWLASGRRGTAAQSRSEFEPTVLHKILVLPLTVLVIVGAILGLMAWPFVYGVRKGLVIASEFWDASNG
jgi:hypothetical protein